MRCGLALVSSYMTKALAGPWWDDDSLGGVRACVCLGVQEVERARTALLQTQKAFKEKMMQTQQAAARTQVGLTWTTMQQQQQQKEEEERRRDSLFDRLGGATFDRTDRAPPLSHNAEFKMYSTKPVRRGHGTHGLQPGRQASMRQGGANRCRRVCRCLRWGGTGRPSGSS